jgi:hypothetical protein
MMSLREAKKSMMSRVTSRATSHTTCRSNRTRGIVEVVDNEPARGEVVDDEPRDQPWR